MHFQVISSGSKGNITFIKTNKCNVLIDTGISLKEINSRVDIDMKTIDAIFITHEHIDHVRYIEKIARETDAVIYVNELSFKQIYNKYIKNIEGLKVKFIKPNETITIKDLKVMPINLQHDVECCYGYIFVSENKSLAYCTDTGFIPLPYIPLLKKVDSFIIEANHDVEMLLQSQRPWHLKNRILSVNGHMSNITCGEILNMIVQEKKLQKIVLAHLSEECNDPELAVDTILQLIEGEYIPEIYVAKQDEALPLLEVHK